MFAIYVADAPEFPLDYAALVSESHFQLLALWLGSFTVAVVGVRLIVKVLRLGLGREFVGRLFGFLLDGHSLEGSFFTVLYLFEFLHVEFVLHGFAGNFERGVSVLEGFGEVGLLGQLGLEGDDWLSLGVDLDRFDFEFVELENVHYATAVWLLRQRL